MTDCFLVILFLGGIFCAKPSKDQLPAMTESFADVISPEADPSTSSG
jgi:hypothetical protein